MSGKRMSLPFFLFVALLFTASLRGGSPCINGTPFVFSPATLPNVPVNGSYNQTVTAIGGAYFPTFSITAGALPPAITMTNDYVGHATFAGTAANVGYFPFTVLAADGCLFWDTYQSYSIAVDFLDVPGTNIFEPFVMKMVANGVAAGCNATHYCPAGSVIRSAMAVLLLRARWGAAYVPPAATGIFGDVPVTNAFAPWIEEVYHEAITAGCSTTPLMYCPGNVVTRAGMSVFLLRTKWGPFYVAPASAQIFNDVPVGNPFEPWINELYNEGITGGCSTIPLNYCPGNAVGRAQMAVFLTATFNLGFPAP